MKMTKTIEELENEINMLQKIVNTQTTKCNRLERYIEELEESMNTSYDLAKAIHEIQEILTKQGNTIFNTIYAPNKVGGV